MDSFSLNQLPRKPHSVEETGLTPSFLKSLALKTLYRYTSLIGHEIASALKLPYANIVAKILSDLRREFLIEIGGSAGSGEAYYRYVITDYGRRRARELMETNQYVGPAPVTLEAYTAMVKAQGLAGQTISPQSLKNALSHLVLSDALINALGPALSSGTSIFLFGGVGNGKTSIGLAIPQALSGSVWIPYAITIDEQIIQIFDSVQHHRADMENNGNNPHDDTAEDGFNQDRRWVLCHRPLIVGGGELTLKDFDLVFDPLIKYYHAPHHVKANGGVFLIDDFGRQALMPSWYDVLNRWIVPLDQRMDHLTLASGQKITLPFEVLVVFATNLDPLQLVDEAYWRRLRNKIQVPNPTWNEFQEIFSREVAQHEIPYSDKAFHYLVEEYYAKPQRQPRGVHPRDILEVLEDIARFRGMRPELSKENIDHACQVYFGYIARNPIEGDKPRTSD